MKRRTWLIGLGLAAAAAVIGIGAVMAQEDGATTGNSFLDRVAAKLGIDTPQLEQAITDARTDEINERVADGDLTQEQADRLLERLESLPEGAPFGFAPFGGPRFRIDGEFGLKGAHGFAFGGPWLGLMGPGEELASFLGIPQEQLLEELSADGATLASVAEAHGKSRDELKTFILDTAETRLDEAVANGNLTQERAEEIYADLESAVDAKIDAEVPFKFERGGEFGFKGGFGFGFGGHGFGLIGPGEELASFLGIPQEQLLEELSADGATLASVAEAHGKSRDEVKAFILENAKTRLDEAVATGNLTQERADQIYADLESAVDAKIDAEIPFKFEHHFEFGPNGDDDEGAEEQGGALDSFFRS